MTGGASTRPGTLSALAAAGVVLGAVATSSNPVFVRLSDVPETASAFHRMAWALPAFAVWGLVGAFGTRGVPAGGGRDVPAAPEPRRSRRLLRAIRIPSEPRDRWLLVLCGVFFAVDLAALHAAVNLTTAANAILFLNAQPSGGACRGAARLAGARHGEKPSVTARACAAAVLHAPGVPEPAENQQFPLRPRSSAASTRLDIQAVGIAANSHREMVSQCVSGTCRRRMPALDALTAHRSESGVSPIAGGWERHFF